MKKNVVASRLLWRSVEPVVRLMDAAGLPKVYTWLTDRTRPHTRKLTEEETAEARLIFQDSIDYLRVRIDERARLVCKSRGCAYVAFNVINNWGPIRYKPLLIHELMHVWQYQHLGAVYIPRALWAQRTPEGYDYGGEAGLLAALEAGKTLLNFNYEQQGDIVADYYCLLRGYRPRFCKADRRLTGVFERVIGNTFTTFDRVQTE